MDQQEPSPALNLLLTALAMILVVLIGLTVLRKTHSWPWVQDTSAYAFSSKRKTATPAPSHPIACVAGHSCLVEGLHCVDAPLVCTNHFWTGIPCVENEPCPPNSVCNNREQRTLFCDPASRNTFQPANAEARQPL